MFDLPGVAKEDMHVSYRADRLVVTWKTVKTTERVEAGKLLRDREEKKFSRTIPLQENTKVSAALLSDNVGVHFRLCPV